jgi:hypothetical protein
LILKFLDQLKSSIVGGFFSKLRMAAVQEYLAAFRKAMERTYVLAPGFSNYPLVPYPDMGLDHQEIVMAVAQDLSTCANSTDAFPGHCFQICREVSYILLDLGVRHAITVGDIKLPDRMYVGVTEDKMVEEFHAGYQLGIHNGAPTGAPINAHAWVTLEDGSVIDATILASNHRRAGLASNPLPFDKAIFSSALHATPDIQHLPMLTGMAYIQRTLISEIDGDAPMYCQWGEDYARLMARIDLYRLADSVPGHSSHAMR